MIRLLLADDEVLIRGAMAALLDLEADICVVGEAADGETAVALAGRVRPDVAVLDLEMPPGDGIAAAEQLTIPVVLVTRHARPGVLRRALGAGVRGFVPKTTPASALAEIIRQVHGGRRYVDQDFAAYALSEQPCPLSPRERDVLRATRQGKPIKEIAAATHLAPGTVRNYLSTAIAKLAVNDRHAAARAAWEQGWI
ncbi:response regulator transcription factor [Actinoplanes sp. NBRC 103695]|uniref:response regulator transcription factor n=1 Tax=Actinoplanes sp. NBRC 103695 TaxID=3032202 RepID=UPI0024A60653|nr:response regulator transcription factor [Actinoplanes sp. NBRC 103695]GLZ01690.1 DNA-binding response regulator [Actinoplanes sp. NBRC 103695]